MEHETMTTEQFLLAHAQSGAISFHMPGHKGADFYVRCGHGEFLRHMMDCDITEIPGADNLFHDEGILKRTAERYSRIYGSDRSYLLVNGTSGGIVASILATVPQGGSLIMARNCHKSVYNALKLGNIEPEYVYPSLIEGPGISGPVRVEDIAAAMEDCPQAAAVILPSPNYYGVCSDIRAIAQVVHAHGKILIVDQAHGAHLKMMEVSGRQPLSAETAGADLVINSTHKTLASFTQSAVLNVKTERVSLQALEDRLQMVESSSPSYLLMASLDINADIMEKQGDELFRQWQTNIDDFYDHVQDVTGITALELGEFHDKTKINLDSSRLGLTGAELEKLLMAEGVHVELSTGNMVMCMTGIGTTGEHLERLLEALKKIAGRYECVEQEQDHASMGGIVPPASVWQKRRARVTVSGEGEKMKLVSCAGRIAGSHLIPYPPGVPLVCAGEVIGPEDVEYLQYLYQVGHDVLGMDSEGMIMVMK